MRQRLLPFVLSVFLFAGCGANLPTLSSNALLYVVTETSHETQLLGINAKGSEVLKSGPLGSMWYKPDTQRLFFVEDNELFRYTLPDKEMKHLYTPAFPDIAVTQVIVRDDEQWFAVLLESDSKHFDGMVPCQQGKFCIMEVGSFQGDLTHLVNLPTAYSYTFVGAWNAIKNYPYVEYQPEATRGAYAYANLDDEGSGLLSLMVKQQGQELPIVEYFSNDLRLDVFSLPAVEERSPDGWRLFYFRSAEQIYHRFPEEFIIPRHVEVLLSPDFNHIAYMLNNEVYMFSLADRTFTVVGKGEHLKRWSTPEELIYIQGENGLKVNMADMKPVHAEQEVNCGATTAQLTYDQDKEHVTFSTSGGATATIDAKVVKFLICNNK